MPRFLTRELVRPTVIALTMTGSALASPPAGLIGHWDFDQTGASMAIDSVSGFNGTLLGGAAMVAGGVSGGAVQLTSATGSLVNMGSVIPLFGTQPCTISMWIKIDGSPGSFCTPIARHTSGTTNGYFLAVNSSGCYGTAAKAWSYRSNGCGGVAISTTTVNDGQWHLIAMTYHPTTGMRFHVDGGPPESIKGGTAVNANTANLLVGGYMIGATPTATFNGMIDDLQIYGRALTCLEINQLFATPGTTAEAGADLNGDGDVDGADLGVLLSVWGTAACDLNNDGVVNGADLGLLLSKWGSC